MTTAPSAPMATHTHPAAIQRQIQGPLPTHSSILTVTTSKAGPGRKTRHLPTGPPRIC